MSSYRIGMNLRVTEDSNQGGRRYMEDKHSIRFVKNDEGGFEFAYFGIFDGHGGGEASKYARDHLLNEITKYDCFWSDNDEDILYAIKTAFLDTHYGMWKEVDKWPKTNSGLPSTSGTTASICIIKNSKLYIGHVGDSGIVLGYDDSRSDKFMRPKAKTLTVEHKPDSPAERERIEESGGQVIAKAGVQRVVWNRPRMNHKGPVRRSTPIDKIPFLAVARSLGDLWSYNYLKEEFVVSPEPDVSVIKLDPSKDKCLIIGSDGLWNMMSSEEAVNMVFDLEYHFEQKVINDPSVPVSYWINPAEKLVQSALNKWRMKLMKADNTSCIVVLIDPLGPRKLSILKKKREEQMRLLAEKKGLDNKIATELLAAKESLHKSPKRHKDAKHENPRTVSPPKFSPQSPGSPTRQVLWNDSTGGMKITTLLKNDAVKIPMKPSPMHKFADNLDDSVQLRITPRIFSEKEEFRHVKSAPCASKLRTSPLQGVSNDGQSRPGMATRQSPHKSPTPERKESLPEKIRTPTPEKKGFVPTPAIHHVLRSDLHPKVQQKMSPAKEPPSKVVLKKVSLGQVSHDRKNQQSYEDNKLPLSSPAGAKVSKLVAHLTSNTNKAKNDSVNFKTTQNQISSSILTQSLSPSTKTTQSALHDLRSLHNNSANTSQDSVNPTQKCLQPSKQSAENIRNAAKKIGSLSELETLLTSSNVKLKNLNVAKGAVRKRNKNLNNSNLSDSSRSGRKCSNGKSLSSRISLRLRRIRQKSFKNKNKIQAENKGFTKGVKRKIDSATDTPVVKKLRHS